MRESIFSRWRRHFRQWRRAEARRLGWERLQCSHDFTVMAGGIVSMDLEPETFELDCFALRCRCCRAVVGVSKHGRVVMGNGFAVRPFKRLSDSFESALVRYRLNAPHRLSAPHRTNCWCGDCNRPGTPAA